jgi:dipeptidase D
LKGKYLLNLDTEDDRELTIGCAGGIDVTVTGSYPTVSASAESLAFKIGISGLTGGHSGMDIHLGRGNANKLMNRLLYRANQKVGLKIASIDGGSLRNAIPRESFAEVVIPPKAEADFRNIIASLSAEFTSEYATTDPELKVSLEAIVTPSGLMGEDFQSDFLRAIYACPNGIYRMSPDIPGLVQTSNNLARVSVVDGVYKVLCLTRSAVESEKMDLAESIRATFMLIGSKVALEGSYPGWTPKPGSPIVKLMSDIYREMYQEEPDVNACHAGLECGILGQNYPRMEMISFGPNIRGAHSPDEKVQISSVQKFWKFLTTTLDKV